MNIVYDFVYGFCKNNLFLKILIFFLDEKNMCILYEG